MAARPYQHMRVDELDRLFTEAPQNAARLEAILSELGFRSTSRALDLKRRLEDHLKAGLTTLPKQATAAAPKQPSPATQRGETQPVGNDDISLEGGEDAKRPRPSRP